MQPSWNLASCPPNGLKDLNASYIRHANQKYLLSTIIDVVSSLGDTGQSTGDVNTRRERLTVFHICSFLGVFTYSAVAQA